jgi:HAD superfamily hydrolase (TIGR01509 family)
MSKDIKGVIFDLDGTLVKTQREFHAVAEAIVLADKNIQIDPESISRQYAGVHTLQVFKELAPAEDPLELLKEKWDTIYCLANLKRIELVEGVIGLLEVIDSLNLPISIASASPIEWIQTCLVSTEISHYFTSLASVDEVKRGKPEPDVFILAARKLGIEPKECIAVEDGESGVKAALKAGMITFWLNESEKEVQGAINIKSLAEIPKYMNWLN